MQFIKLPKSRHYDDDVIKSKRHSLCLVVAIKISIFPVGLNKVS